MFTRRMHFILLTDHHRPLSIVGLKTAFQLTLPVASRDGQPLHSDATSHANYLEPQPLAKLNGFAA